MYTTLLAFLCLPLAIASPCQGGDRYKTSIYLTTNEQQNSVVALPIGRNGLLGNGTSIPTGGRGASGLLASNNQPSAPDSLFSQAALTVSGKYLFAVNAGSNSLSMFLIDHDDSTKLTLVQEPLSLPGEFPVTVAASQKKNLVCVGFSGAKAGISCAKFSAHGIEAMDQLRPIELGQTTPPHGPLNTVSQVFFAADEKTLYSTVKGDPMVNNTGYFASFPIQDGKVSNEGVRSSPNGTAVLFGSVVIPGTSDVFVTDASFGAAILDVTKDGKAISAHRGPIAGQMATCWATVNQRTGTGFVTDAVVNRLVEVSLADASVQSSIDLSANGDPGLLDLVSHGKYVYALSGGNGTTEAAIVVVDAISKKQVQHQSVAYLGAGKSSAGLAINWS
ncbi:unnamed protein product [Clonostachys rosea f. rosea IK726]|uniref:3-carboxymuconate cyclase n=2 Tax=Bionectria ochroleuca TaxID=29856 RepID=A0A0B7KFY8_BIOOC|nr:unnamed protein product [Clonostachys rosea f. rosea IK726]